MYTLSLVFALLALLNITAAVPIPKPGLVRRANVTTPLGLGADTGGDIPALANGIGEFSPIEDGFLEGDSDSGDGNDNGSSGSSVANGLGSVGSASESNTDTSSGSTSSACSLLECTSAAQSNNANNTSTSTSSNGVGAQPVIMGPVIGNGNSGGGNS